MNRAPLSPELSASVVRRHLQPPFPAAGAEGLVAVLRHVHLDAGEVLIREGEQGSDLFLVLDGRLDVSVDNPDGSVTHVDQIPPGGVAGEMALLTGLPRTATVRAADGAEVARLSRDDFEALAQGDRSTLNEFLRRVLPRLRRTQLLRLLAESLGPLDEAALRDIEPHLEWVYLPGGERLFGEGDPGGDVYIVVNGRVRATMRDPEGVERTIEEVGRGGMIGEVSLLTGEPRSASVDAIRDSDLVRLPQAAFDALAESQPRAMMEIARAAAWRLRRSSHPRERRAHQPTCFAVLAASASVPLGEFTRRLVETLDANASVLHLDSSGVDALLGRPGIAQSGDDSLVHEPLVAWLASQERSHSFVVLEADAAFTPWTRRCLRQADRVLVVASASGDSEPGEIERAVAQMGLHARSELVLLHPDDTPRPSGTAAWLAKRDVAAHHHVRLGHPADLRRAARRISGRAAGLVLGGGGARGFAHIGALRALGERQVEIDVAGGTSIGAVISAAYASGLGAHDMLEVAKTFASRAKLLDRTLPVVSLMAGRKLTALYRKVFGDIQIEDLWMPFFAVSSGLSRAAAVVHTRGSLWKAVRASTAIPAIFPPMLGEDNEVLVDGNVMNNMPLDVMREWCESGTVIGVNPMPTRDKLKPYAFGPSVSGWAALFGRLRWFGSRVRAPSILGAVMRATEINSANRMRQASFRALADVLIEPALEEYPILAFDHYAPIVEIGYHAAREALAQWQGQTSASVALDEERTMVLGTAESALAS